MKVFISWSKKQGLDFAIATKALLESIDPNITAFVSEVDISGGEDVQNKIIERINSCDRLILCFTKETKKSPWLLFEAGYARGCGKRVIPFLFDNDPAWHSWIDNPMNVARELRVCSESFVFDFVKAFDLKDSKTLRNRVGKYINEISNIKEKYRKVDIKCEDFVEQLLSEKAFTIENPYYRDRTTYFVTGFESFELYKIITEAFLYTGKYLWIFGRKNMKLFSGNYNKLFDYLKEKSFEEHLNMDGIDFRCLFLNPYSDEVMHAHRQQQIFLPELKASIARAKDVIGNNSALQKCFRMYSKKRDEIIIRIDNTIVYARPVFDANGQPQLLTNTGFEVFSSESEKGIACIRRFEAVWNESEELFI